jgi:hypothetical protein
MTFIATCHCGATRIELPKHPRQARSCNCTFCTRAGAIWAYYRPDELNFLSRAAETIYSASGGMNKHHFCSTCGVQTWGDSPDWASMYNADGSPKNGDPDAMPTEHVYQVNLNLVDDLDWSKIEIEELDGRNSW